MLDTNSTNISGKPIQLYDIDIDNLAKANISQLTNFFKNEPDYMNSSQIRLGYSTLTNKLKAISANYDADIPSDMIATTTFQSIKGVHDPKVYATALIKRYIRWLKSEKTRQSKAITTIADTVHLVENRHKRRQVNSLLFSIHDYMKWIISNLDIINGEEFASINDVCNDFDYCLNLLIIKLENCPKIKSSTISEIVYMLNDYSNNKSLDARHYELIKKVYRIINHEDGNCQIIYDKPIRCYYSILSYLIDDLGMKTISIPIGMLWLTSIQKWHFKNQVQSLTLKLYDDADIQAIIQGYTNPISFPTHITYDGIKEVIEQENIRIDLNDNQALLKKRIKQLAEFDKVPAFAKIVQILNLILENNEE